MNMCWRASNWVDAYCNQPLRSDVCQEEITGPDFRMTVSNSTGVGQMIASRWPITEIVGGQYSPASVFRNVTWQPLLPTQMRAWRPIQTIGVSAAPDASGSGSMLIEIEPGNISWFAGRNGYRLQVAYVSGWPHTSLTSAASVGATTINVDDVTGWAGSVGQIYWGAETETITCTSVNANTTTTVFGQTVATGPGTLTLASPLLYNHEIATMVTSMPFNVIWATVLMCCAQALTRGGVATVLPAVPFPGTSSTVNVQRFGTDANSMQMVAQQILAPYRRII